MIARPGRCASIALCLALQAACGGEEGAEDARAPADAGRAPDAPRPDAGRRDAPPDGGDADAASTDAGADAGGADAGAGRFALAPGARVTWPGGQVEIGGDDFGAVTGRLGPGRRDAREGARSYTWTLSGFDLTVWFANSNLDGDDAAPSDVDDTDRVLWVAVGEGFSGTTAEGIGLGSTRAEVEAAFGPAPRETAVTSPPGTLFAYYARGVLVTFDPSGSARSVTVSRAYPTEPGGTFDVSDAEVALPMGRLRGTRGLTAPGTERADIRRLLGPPDGTGAVRFGQVELTTWSYGFFGLELFFLGSADQLLFLTLHAPYYGTTSGGVGVGSSRAEVEALLRAEGYPNGAPSSTSPRLVCYGEDRDLVGVTYSDAGAATSFTFRLLACP